MKSKEYINPYKLFTGIFIPEALLSYPGVSTGAKLCYGRLCRYAGDKGFAYPKQDTLAKEIAVSNAQVRRYLDELIKDGWIESKQIGLHSPNEYRFLKHPVLSENMELSDAPMSDQGCSYMSDQGCSYMSSLIKDERESLPRESLPSIMSSDDLKNHPKIIIWKEIIGTTLRTNLSDQVAAANRIDEDVGESRLMALLMAVRVIRQDKYGHRGLQIKLVNYIGLEKNLEAVEAVMQGLIDKNQVDNKPSEEDIAFFGKEAYAK